MLMLLLSLVSKRIRLRGNKKEETTNEIEMSDISSSQGRVIKKVPQSRRQVVLNGVKIIDL